VFNDFSHGRECSFDRLSVTPPTVKDDDRAIRFDGRYGFSRIRDSNIYRENQVIRPGR
jgi:hypothetical protein